MTEQEEKKVGRPTKRTPEVEERILAALRDGNTRRAAYHFGGISHETFYNWMEDFAEFREAVKRAEADAEVIHVRHISKAAESVWTASAWWLERRYPEDWGRRETIRHTGKDDQTPIQMRVIEMVMHPPQEPEDADDA